jgi:hypothetical protein
MNNRSRYAMLPALAVAMFLGGCAIPVGAQVRYPGRGVYDVRGPAYDNGYRRGYDQGIADARSRRAADVRRQREYRDGDWGYDRRLGSKGEYKERFRDGFEAGYRQGYGGAGWTGDRDRRTLPPGERYPDQRGAYGNWGYGGRGNTSQLAFNYGYNDGYDRGAKAARGRKAFDPNREDWYRDGDRHYDDDYGPRDQYRAAYRDGFMRGYEEGYGKYGYYRR